jgi:WD40 repeat protein
VSGGKEVAGHTKDVWSVAFSPDGQFIVSGSGDKLVKVWSASARKLRRWLDTRAVFFRSPDGQHIVSGSEDKLVKVWSVSGGKEVASLAGHTEEIYSVAFSPDGQHIVSGSGDKLVTLWSVSGGKEVASTRSWLVRSPSVQMGIISFLEVRTSW